MSSYKTLPTPGDTAWFTHDRFGMFIHFGLYAMPARHEWVKNYEEIPEDHYDLYFKHFNPDLYDPKEWARQAKAAGMKYVVMTTKQRTLITEQWNNLERFNEFQGVVNNNTRTFL